MAKKQKNKNSEAEKVNLEGENPEIVKDPENSPEGENEGNSEESKDDSEKPASTNTGKKEEVEFRGSPRLAKLNNLKNK